MALKRVQTVRSFKAYSSTRGLERVRPLHAHSNPEISIFASSDILSTLFSMLFSLLFSYCLTSYPEVPLLMINSRSAIFETFTLIWLLCCPSWGISAPQLTSLIGHLKWRTSLNITNSATWKRITPFCTFPCRYSFVDCLRCHFKANAEGRRG